jgi:GAF domain-containing protein
MTPRTTAARTADEYVHRLHDDLSGALKETDRLRSQVEQMVATNQNLSALLLSSDVRSGEMMKLLVAVRALIESRDATAAIAGLHDILVNVVGTTDFFIYGLDHDADELVPMAGSGHTFDPIGRLSLGASWLGRVIQSGQVIIARPHGQTVPLGGLTTAAVVPLKVLDRVLGAILIARVLPHREPLDVCDRDVLGLLGAYAATAIIAAERRREWYRLPMVAL